MPAEPPDAGQLRPCDRFDWERIVRRCRLSGPTKVVAFVLAQFADGTGRNCRPGTPRLAACCEVSTRVVERHLAKLRALGLVEKISNGGGPNGRAAEYRLTIPEDLPERVEMLDPDERTPATSGGSSGRTPVVSGGSSGPAAENSRHYSGGSSPVDNRELPPSVTELPPLSARTPATDPPVTSNNAHHHPLPTKPPTKAVSGERHQRATPARITILRAAARTSRQQEAG